MGAPTWDIRVDWNNDGDYTDTGEDITTRVLERTNLSIQYGRDQARALSPTRPGEARLEVNNTSRDYSPENTSSPLAGLMGPGRPIRVEATHNAVTYTVYRGNLDEYEVLPDREHRSVALTALDGLGRLKEITVSTALHQAMRTGTAVGFILDAIGWTAGRDLDPGASTVRWWWEEGTDALTALNRLTAAEGPPSFVTIGADGEFIFRDRHHRLTRTESTSVQATFRDTGTEPTFSGSQYDAGWRDVVNSVEFEIHNRALVRLDPDVIWQMSGQRRVSPGETITFDIVDTQHLWFSAITPTQTGSDPDFVIAGSGTLGFALNRSSGQSFRLTVFLPLGGSAVTITAGRLRGYEVDDFGTSKVLVEDAASISLHGRRTHKPDAPWLSLDDADSVARVILAQRATRLPIVTIRLVGGNDTRLVQQLSRDLSDRVRIIEPESGLDGEFFIDRISHTVTDAGKLLSTEFGCEKAPTQPSNLFTFDVAGKGFNDGVFNVAGLDDPTTVFRFDHATQGKFDVGLFGN